ncbi:MAG: glutamate racemase [Acidiferrobacteraceae bacterium]
MALWPVRAMDSSQPIGVFDSGVGGLTVVRALMERLPGESILYFGDTARVPYGVKSVATVTSYAVQIAQFLLERRVKLLIIACNTIAAVAAQAIAALSDTPVLDVIAAGASAAVRTTRTGRIGVIGTLTTVNSGAYEQALRHERGDLFVASQACPLLVPLVEEGWLTHEVTRQVAAEYLAPVLAQGIDTLILGCTHYPLLQPLLGRVAGPGVALVDSAETVAGQALRLLADRGLGCTGGTPYYEFYVTDVPLRFRAIGEQFLGRPFDHVQVVPW